MHHSALQHPLVVLTTNSFNWYFLAVPGFELGYICQMAGYVSTRPLPLMATWIFVVVLLLSTYFQVQER